MRTAELTATDWRMLVRIQVGDECWEFDGGHSGGYAMWHNQLVHRRMYEILVGPIPEGLVLDHVECENKGCVRPDHTAPCTSGENSARSFRRERCKQGHLLEWIGGRRGCRPCRVEATRRWRERNA